MDERSRTFRPGETGRVCGILARMAVMLDAGEEPSWAGALALCMERMESAETETVQELARQLLGFCGGRGSLSGLVLVRNGQADRGVNDRFNALRAELNRILPQLLPPASGPPA